MQIYCCECGEDVQAELISGEEAYPHRHDLYDLPFWQCPTCDSFVGCHHKTKDRTRPLGCIPSDELKAERRKLHQLIDPVWRSKRIGRSELYCRIAKQMGQREFHVGETRSVGEVQAAAAHAAGIIAKLEGAR